MICIYRKADGLVMMSDAQYRPNELCDNTVYDLGDYTGVTVPVDWIDPIIVPAEDAVYDENGTLVKEAVEEKVIPNPFTPRNITDLVGFQARNVLEKVNTEAAKVAQAENDRMQTVNRIANSYLDLCQLVCGERRKLTFDDLRFAVANNTELSSSSFGLAVKFMMISMEGVRELGEKWWDYV